MERQRMTRRGILSAGALTLAGATLATTAPRRALAGVPDAQAINIASFMDAVNNGLNQPDLTKAFAVIDQHISPTAVDHQIYGLPWLSSCFFSQTGFNCPGRDAIKLLLQLLRQAFPDFHTTIEDVAASGDKVFGRAISNGSFAGTFVTNSGVTVQGQGQPFSIEIHDEFRFEHLTTAQLAMGQIPLVVEHWGVSDTLSLLIQIGVLDPLTLPHL